MVHNKAGIGDSRYHTDSQKLHEEEEIGWRLVAKQIVDMQTVGTLKQLKQCALYTDLPTGCIYRLRRQLMLVCFLYFFVRLHHLTFSIKFSYCHLPFPHRAFRINELKTEVTNRIAMLEKRVECEWSI